MSTEVGVAYVRVLPSMDGFKADLSKGLTGAMTDPARKAGEAAGAEYGKGIDKGIDGSKGKLTSAAGRVGDIFKAGLATAGIAGAAALTAGLAGALETGAVTDKLEAQLGSNNIWAADAGKIAANLYGQAFGDSMADTADAVKQVIQSGVMAGADDMSAASLEKLTAQALTFSDVLDQDLNMSLQAVDRMLATGLASSAEEAFDVLTAGIQSGADSSGDLLETFQEYSTIFRDIGLDASEATGLMSQGLEAGARDADTVADALKEFAIRAQDGSDASAEGFRRLGIDAEAATLSVAAGGDSARLALQYTLEELQKMEDPVERNAAAVALFGTKAEDLGDALFSLDLEGAAAAMDGSAGATDELGSAYDNASTKLEMFKRQGLQRLIEFVGGTVIPGLERLADIVGPTLSTVFGTARDIIGQFFGALTTGFTEDEGTGIELFALKVREFVFFLKDDALPVVQEVLAQVAALWAEHGDKVIEIVGQLATLVGAAIDLVVAAIERGVAIGGWIWANFGDEIVAVISIAWGLISGIVSAALDIITGIVKVATGILSGDWSLAWEGIKLILSGAVDLIITILRGLFDTLKVVVSVGWALIRAGFSAGVAVVKALVGGAIDAVVDFFRKLPGRVRSAMSTLASTITAPFRDAFNSIKSLWNRTAGGFSFSIPDWIPQVGGKGFTIPKMHTGGVFTAAGGATEGLALLEQGEGVFNREQLAALGGAINQPAGSNTVVLGVAPGADALFQQWIQHVVRTVGGGSVQAAFGRGPA